MRAISLGFRSVCRNLVRTTLVVLVMGLSVGLFLTMLATGASTREQARRLRAQVATLIEVNPAGQAGGGSGRRSLPGDVAALKALPKVARVERYVRRQFVNNKRKPATGVLVGVEPGASLRLSAMGGFISSPRLIAGRGFVPEDADRPVAIVGKVFAQNLGLALGSRFSLPAAEFQRRTRPDPKVRDLEAEVIGIFETRVLYGDNQVFVPLELARRTLGLDGDRVSQYYVTAQAADHVPRVAKSIRQLLGGRADVISQDAAALAAARSFEAVSVNSRWGASISALAGALVIFFTMFLVTRERTREIGVLKAIGASDGDVGRLFAAETAALAILGGALGFLIYAGPGGALVLLFLGEVGTAGGLAGQYGISGGQLAYGIALTAIFALAGSAYPVARAIRMRPASAMRAA
ncbi:MAG: ABC transporter permease [Nitrospinota bacterium]